MSTLIQCPACSQKFNLQGRLPALFTCTKCQQPMDLTGFPGYVPEEPAAPAPSRAAAPSRGGGKSSHSSSRSRRRSREEEEEDDRRARFEPKKKNQGLLIWGLVGGLLVVVIVVVVLYKKEDTTKPRTREEVEASGGSGTPVAWSGAPGTTVPGTPVPGTPGVGGTTPGTPAPGAPGTTAPDPAAGKPKPSTLSLKTWPTPDDVSKEDQQRIDQALETALNQVGIDQRQAEKTLVAMGRKAIWRLVSEFKHIADTDTFEGRKGLIKAMITDRILRKIDGHMERNTGYKMPINPESTLEYSTGVAKQWNGWLERGLYKKELPPWDDRVDGQDEPKEKPAPRGR